MSTVMKIKISLILLPLALCAKKNNYFVEHIANCPEEKNLAILMSLNVNNSAKVANKVLLSGHVESTEKIVGPLEVSLEVVRCDSNAESCTKHDQLKVLKILCVQHILLKISQFTGICKFLNRKNGLLADAMNSVQPRLKCPLTPGKYVLKETTLNLSSLSIIVLDDWRYIITFKGLSGEGKNKKLVLCFRFDVLVTNFERRGK